MSNQLLGTVYLQIMDRVIEDCHNTFEEDGVNQQTLEDLKSLNPDYVVQAWQKKLSDLKVGSFPWDPPPPPQPMTNPAVLSNVPRQNQMQPGGAAAAPVAVPNNGGGGPRIKVEPGYEGPQIPSLPPNYNHNEARERAVANLHQKFGAEANPQINQLQAQMAMKNPPSQQKMPGINTSQPPLTPEQQRERQADYQRRQHAAAYQQMQQVQKRPVTTNNPQTDGTDDWDTYVAERRLQSSDASRQADLTIRQQVEQESRSMEAGGFMMPLSEQSKLPQMKKRKLDAGQGSSNSNAAALAAQSSDSIIPQTDGGDDSEEDSKVNIKDELFDDEDEDAINSELDDPDDNEIEEEQEDGKPTQVMLCTYDKVQRVRNRWKCTLRDGVLNSGGKE
ncbi:MAG: hypothetical protein Q9163_001358 [Psora crenata]